METSGCSCRRSMAILLAGAVVGAAVGGFVFFYHWQGRPRYAASVPFQILPPPERIGEDSSQTPTINLDDMQQVLHRQEFIVDQDTFLQDVLKSDEFHPALDPMNPDKRSDCRWLAAHNEKPMEDLRADLTIVPDTASASFKMVMTTDDPKEAVSLVIAASKVYRTFLENATGRVKSAALARLNEALKQQETNFAYKSSELEDFGRKRGIDVLRSRFEIERSRLQSLNLDFMKYDSQAASADQQYKMVQSKKDARGEVELTPDMQLYVENDPTLRSLVAARLSWEQEMAAQKSVAASAPDPVAPASLTGEDTVRVLDSIAGQAGQPTPATGASSAQPVPAPAGPPTVARNLARIAIQARVDEIDRQIDVRRRKLTQDAADRMVETLRNDATSKASLAAYVGDKRTQEEQVVRDLGQDLMAYQQRVDDLKDQQGFLNKIRRQRELMAANQFTDDTRVQQLADAPAIPEEPVVPNWLWYFPTGAGGGLLLSGMLTMGLKGRRQNTYEDGVDAETPAPTATVPVLKPDEGVKK